MHNREISWACLPLITDCTVSIDWCDDTVTALFTVKRPQQTQLLSLQLHFSIANELHDTESLLRNQLSLGRVGNSNFMRTGVSSPSSQRPKLDPVLSQKNLFHILSPYSSKINFKSFYNPRLRLPSVLFLSDFRTSLLSTSLLSHTRYVSDQSNFLSCYLLISLCGHCQASDELNFTGNLHYEKECKCSLYLVWKRLPVWPKYAIRQSGQVGWYIITNNIW
jgi:hypothetical protein